MCALSLSSERGVCFCFAVALRARCVCTVQAEHLAGSMIEQGRLKGSIDQVESLIEFHSGGDELDSWDEGIGSVCLAVNKVLDEINRKYPGAYEV